MDDVRSFNYLWVRTGFRALQFLLGLTVCGLYAAPARSGSGACALAVSVATLSVLTVVAAVVIGFWNGARTAFFLWEVVLCVLWVGASGAIQADSSVNGAVGIDWVNTFLWLSTAVITGFICWTRGGLRFAWWRAPLDDDVEAPGDTEADHSSPSDTRNTNSTLPQDWEHLDQGSSPVPEVTQRNKDSIVELLRRYHEVLEEQQQAQQQLAQLRTELADVNARRLRDPNVQRPVSAVIRDTRSSEPQITLGVGLPTRTAQTDAYDHHNGRPSIATIPPIEQLQTCAICMEDKPSVSGFPVGLITANCRHTARSCRTCIATSIRTNLDSNVWNDVRCPECNEPLDYGDVRRFADPETFIRYDRHSTRSALDADPNFRWCRGPNCEAGQLHASGMDQPIVTCVRCGFRTYFRHQEPWHEGLTCERYDALRLDPENFQIHVETEERATHPAQRIRSQDDPVRRQRLELEQQKQAMKRRAREEAASAKEVGRSSKPCPGCNRPIQKLSGCDHMKCSQCRYEFCWVCLANYERVRWFGNSAHRNSCTHHR